MQYRLQTEYNAESRLESADITLVHWLRHKEGKPVVLNELTSCPGAIVAHDESDRPVVLLSDIWAGRVFASRNASIEMLEDAPRA